MSTFIDEADGTASLDVALETASHYKLRPDMARHVVREVEGGGGGAARGTASGLGLSKNEIDRMASAFEHDDLRKATASSRNMRLRVAECARKFPNQRLGRKHSERQSSCEIATGIKKPPQHHAKFQATAAQPVAGFQANGWRHRSANAGTRRMSESCATIYLAYLSYKIEDDLKGCSTAQNIDADGAEDCLPLDLQHFVPILNGIFLRTVNKGFECRSLDAAARVRSRATASSWARPQSR